MNRTVDSTRCGIDPSVQVLTFGVEGLNPFSHKNRIECSPQVLPSYAPDDLLQKTHHSSAIIRQVQVNVKFQLRVHNLLTY